MAFSFSKLKLSGDVAIFVAFVCKKNNGQHNNDSKHNDIISRCNNNYHLHTS